MVDGSYPTINFGGGASETYTWVSVDGIVLSDATAKNPTFTAPNVSPGVPEAKSFTLTLDDGAGNTHTITSVVTVNHVNSSPAIDSLAVVAAEPGVVYSYTITTTDADNDVPTSSSGTLPNWLTLTDNGDGTATLAGTPSEANLGMQDIVLTANDGTSVSSNNSATQSFTIKVSKHPSGSGTVSDPYLIATLGELYWLSQTSSEWASGKYYVQTADIDASTTSLLDNGAGWTPLGNSSTNFKANYDGGGYVISGLFINRPTVTNVSFIGYGTGKISNLGLENVNITGKGSTAGFIARGSGVTIDKCYVTGTVKGNGDGVGGFMNRSSGTVSISNCYSRASVTGTNGAVGGFLGYGDNGSATISNCYSTGSVSAGWMYAGFAGFTGPTYSNSFWDMETSGQTNGQYQGALPGVTGKTTSEMQTASLYTDSGWSTDIWNLADGSYPTLKPPAPPNNAPTGLALSAATVAENEAAGTVVGTFSTTDDDTGDMHAYTLVSGTGDTDNVSFTIDGETLKTAASFDYETKSSYSIRVKTDDGNGGTFQQTFTITVTDDTSDNPQVVTYGWENGGVYLGKSGNLKSAVNVGAENGVTPHEGSKM